MSSCHFSVLGAQLRFLTVRQGRQQPPLHEVLVENLARRLVCRNKEHRLAFTLLPGLPPRSERCVSFWACLSLTLSDVGVAAWAPPDTRARPLFCLCAVQTRVRLAGAMSVSGAFRELCRGQEAASVHPASSGLAPGPA